MYKTFQKYLFEQENIDSGEIENNPIYRLKQNISNIINELLTWLEENIDNLELSEIKNNIFNFKNELISYNEELFPIINNLNVRIKYNHLFNELLDLIDKLKTIKVNDIEKEIELLTNKLKEFQAYVQSKISLD